MGEAAGHLADPLVSCEVVRGRPGPPPGWGSCTDPAERNRAFQTLGIAHTGHTWP